MSLFKPLAVIAITIFPNLYYPSIYHLTSYSTYFVHDAYVSELQHETLFPPQLSQAA